MEWASFGLFVFMAFFLQAEDGIRDLVRSRGLGDMFKRQDLGKLVADRAPSESTSDGQSESCVLYTSDAADE